MATGGSNGGGGGSGTSSSVAATAIAIIRLTGSQSLNIIQSLLLVSNQPHDHSSLMNNEEHKKKKEDKADIPKVAVLQPRRVYLRKLYHPMTREILDEVIVIYYQKPFSYTGEDCIEVQCHGSRAVIHDILTTFQECYSTSNNHPADLFLRLAEPGEFTQRAYRNGKMDLLQIEALSDLIHADTSVQRKQTLYMYNGQVSEIYLN